MIVILFMNCCLWHPHSLLPYLNAAGG